jgi:multisubunit Na+/H+ antiporter MnhE subunit
VSAGIACTFAVAFLTYEMQLLELSPVRPPHHLLTVPWPRIWSYIVWLLREIAIANWQVLKIVLDPKLPIDPAVIRFRSGLQTDLGKTTLANSITLTPGTITVQVDGDEFVVHALVGGEPVVAGLKEMEDRIKRALPGIEPEVVS